MVSDGETEKVLIVIYVNVHLCMFPIAHFFHSCGEVLPSGSVSKVQSWAMSLANYDQEYAVTGQLALSCQGRVDLSWPGLLPLLLHKRPLAIHQATYRLSVVCNEICVFPLIGTSSLVVLAGL